MRRAGLEPDRRAVESRFLSSRPQAREEIWDALRSEREEKGAFVDGPARAEPALGIKQADQPPREPSRVGGPAP